MRPVVWPVPEGSIVASESKSFLEADNAPLAHWFFLYLEGEFRHKYRFLSDVDRVAYKKLVDADRKAEAALAAIDNGAFEFANIMDGPSTALGLLVGTRLKQKTWYPDYGENNEAGVAIESVFISKVEGEWGASAEHRAAGAIACYYGANVVELSAADGMYDSYCDTLQSAISEGAKNDGYLALLAEMNYTRGLTRMDKARAALAQCTDKGGYMHLSRLGDLERVCGNYAEALKHFGACTGVLKNDWWVRVRMIHCMLETGDASAALALLKQLDADAANGKWQANLKKPAHLKGTDPVDEAKLSAAQLQFHPAFCRWVAGSNRAAAFSEMKDIFKSLGVGDPMSEDLSSALKTMPIHVGVFWFHHVLFEKKPMPASWMDVTVLGTVNDVRKNELIKNNIYVHEFFASLHLFAWTLSSKHPMPDTVDFGPQVQESMAKETRQMGATKGDRAIGLALAACSTAFSYFASAYTCGSAYRNMADLSKMDTHLLLKLKPLFWQMCGVAGVSVDSVPLLSFSEMAPTDAALEKLLTPAMVVLKATGLIPEVDELDADVDSDNDSKMMPPKTMLLSATRKMPTDAAVLTKLADLLLFDGKPRVALALFQEALRRQSVRCRKKEIAIMRTMACAYYTADCSFWPAVVRYFAKFLKRFGSTTGGKVWYDIANNEKKMKAKNPLTLRLKALKKKFEEAFDEAEENEAFARQCGDDTQLPFYKGVYSMALVRLGMFAQLNNASIFMGTVDFVADRTCANAWCTFMILMKESQLKGAGPYSSVATGLYKKDQKNPLGNVFNGFAQLPQKKKQMKKIQGCLATAEETIGEFFANEKIDVFDAHLCCALAGLLSCAIGEDPGDWHSKCDGEYSAGRTIAGLIVRHSFTAPLAKSLTAELKDVRNALNATWYKCAAADDKKVTAICELAGIDSDDALIQMALTANAGGAKAIPQFQCSLDFVESQLSQQPFSGEWPPKMADVPGIDPLSDTFELVPVKEIPAMASASVSDVTGVFQYAASYGGGEEQKSDEPPPAAESASAPSQPRPEAMVEEKKEEVSAPAMAVAQPIEEPKPVAKASTTAASAPPMAVPKAAPKQSTAPKSAAAPKRTVSAVPKAAAMSSSAMVAMPVQRVRRPVVAVEKPAAMSEVLSGGADMDTIRARSKMKERQLMVFRRVRRDAVERWNPDDVGDFIEALPFYGTYPEYYSYCLRKNDVSGSKLLSVGGLQQLEDWGVFDVVHRVRILSEVIKMKTKV